MHDGRPQIAAVIAPPDGVTLSTYVPGLIRWLDLKHASHLTIAIGYSTNLAISSALHT